jgi:hypothetical protein
LTVAGTFVFDRSYVFPANIYCNIYVGGVLKGGGLVGTAMTFSGSYSTTYPGGAPLIPGAAHVDVFLSAGQSQAGADFTLT